MCSIYWTNIIFINPNHRWITFNFTLTSQKESKIILFPWKALAGISSFLTIRKVFLVALHWTLPETCATVLQEQKVIWRNEKYWNMLEMRSLFKKKTSDTMSKKTIALFINYHCAGYAKFQFFFNKKKIHVMQFLFIDVLANSHHIVSVVMTDR